MREEVIESTSLPPHLMTDLGYSIAMFLLAVVGARFTLKNCFGIDLLNFRTLPAQIAGTIAGVLVLLSIYKLMSNPRRVERLGRKLVGRQYVQEQTKRKIQVANEAVASVKQAKKEFEASNAALSALAV